MSAADAQGGESLACRAPAERGHGTLASLVLLVVGAAVTPAVGQQTADPDFRPVLAAPTYARGEGPLVLVDEAHHNFHTAVGRYRPFADLLERDGYRVASLADPLSAAVLAPARVLVIANALHGDNVTRWTLPTPAAFTDAEVAALVGWVRQGGALLLIADHMPFPGGASNIAAAFDVSYSNGFAMRPDHEGPDLFTRADGTLLDHPVTVGRDAADRIERLATFTGSAFECSERMAPVITLPRGFVSLEPQRAWDLTDETPRRAVEGWCQGATLEPGHGRVAVFGEAAMFTAQLAGPNKVPMGMNAPVAAENPRFLLNVVRWLAAER